MPESDEPYLRQTGLGRLSRKATAHGPGGPVFALVSFASASIFGRKTTGRGGPTNLKSDLPRRRHLSAGGRNSSWQKSPIKQVPESRNENKKAGHKLTCSAFVVKMNPDAFCVMRYVSNLCTHDSKRWTLSGP